MLFAITKKQRELKEKFLREKNFIDEDLELYRKQKQLEIDQNIEERKLNNWKEVDEARRKRMEAIAECKGELMKLEAKKEFLKELTEQHEKTVQMKDAEIKRLLK